MRTNDNKGEVNSASRQFVKDVFGKQDVYLETALYNAFHAVFLERLKHFEKHMDMILPDNPKLKRVFEVLNDEFEVLPKELRTKSRAERIRWPRQVFHWLMGKKAHRIIENKFSLKEIGMLTGGHNHATVLHSIKTVRQEAETNLKVRNQLIRICLDLDVVIEWNSEEKRFDIVERLNVEPPAKLKKVS